MQPIEPAPTRRLSDLSLLELIPRLIFRPGATLESLSQTLTQTATVETLETPRAQVINYAMPYPSVQTGVTFTLPTIDWAAQAPVLGMISALLIGLGGSLLMFGKRMENPDVTAVPIGGYILLFAGAIMGVVCGLSVAMPAYPRLQNELEENRPRLNDLEAFLGRYGLRIVLFLLAGVFTVGAWVLNTAPSYGSDQPANVVFTDSGVFCWLMSIICWFGAFNDASVRLMEWLSGLRDRVRDVATRPINLKPSWTLVAMVIILIVGAYFRFGNLRQYPPDMTSDHVEKALDSYHIFTRGVDPQGNLLPGDRPVFLPNNGGREPFHFYFLALLEATTQHPMDFDLLKIGSGIWGMLELLLAFWAGRAIFGEENPDFGNLVGVCMSALIAVSYWATMLSRLGLRIVTTTLVMTVLMVFVIRAMRHNRRIDFIMAGVTLGWGTYCYQSARLFPLLVVFLIPIFLIIQVRSWTTFRKFFVNMVAMTMLAVAVFLPLGHYAVNFPGFFWSRATGRLVGYDTYSGVPITFGDFLGKLKVTLLGDPTDPQNPGLTYTIKKSLLMFNYRGDIEWFTGTPTDAMPEMDMFAGTLFVLGCGIMIARMIRRRDMADWVLFLAIFVGILPSAFAVAFASQEVPSSTRASGALPVVYLIAAFALAVILNEISKRVTVRVGRYALYAGAAGLFVSGATFNYGAYFTSAMIVYRQSTLPHGQVGRMVKDFSTSIGAYGNAFVMGYPYWLDKRAVGIEAGQPDWQNGIDEQNPPTPDRSRELQDLLNFIGSEVDNQFPFRTDRYVMIFLNKEDMEMAKALSNTFPNGWLMHIPVDNTLGSSEYENKDFYIFIAPPTGCDWWTQHFPQTRLPQSCARVPNGPGEAFPASTLTTPLTPAPQGR
jgi:hypothetical protein